jgi:hypothetical protein
MRLLILLLLISFNTYAAVGTITTQTALPGTITRSAKPLEGKKGVGVEMNDKIQTTKGKLGITFQDETKVEINESSKLVIDDFVFDAKKPSAGKLAMKFTQGTVRYASGAIAHANPAKVGLNTPSATIAVRGTDFTATVDEMGESTIILLPSCPANWKDIERDCKTGAIDVLNDAGMVSLNVAFQGTKVASRNTPPMKPTVLNLTTDTINNLLIVSPPRELRHDDSTDKTKIIHEAGNMLDVNFLKQDFLKNELSSQATPYGDNPLTQPLLEQYFLENIFDILAEQLQAEQTAMLQNLIAPQNNNILPDYKKSTGVTEQIGASEVTLCRNDGSNNQCIATPKDQNSTIYETQGSVTIKNRVNQGAGTSITVIQR